MKYLLITPIMFTLTACGMSIEEYNAGVKYCNDNNMTAVIEYHPVPDRAVRNIRCVDANGTTFSSKSK